jgi:uncharacterized protein YbjT (DUF2867 family)
VPKRLCLVGATGLVGMTLIERAIPRSDVRIIGIARREVQLPFGARMEMLLADPASWPDAIAAAQAQVLICALGTTWRKAGKDETSFRAVDYDLVLRCAKAAKAEGIEHFILVSSVGADTASKNFYLRVKGEVEAALARIGFRRLDIVRPGLRVGPRGDDRRPGERLAILLSPLADLFLHGKYRKFRSIRATILADAILALAKQKAGGRFVHEYDAIRYAVRRAGD